MQIIELNFKLHSEYSNLQARYTLNSSLQRKFFISSLLRVLQFNYHVHLKHMIMICIPEEWCFSPSHLWKEVVGANPIQALRKASCKFLWQGPCIQFHHQYSGESPSQPLVPPISTEYYERSIVKNCKSSISDNSAIDRGKVHYKGNLKALIDDASILLSFKICMKCIEHPWHELNRVRLCSYSKPFLTGFHYCLQELMRAHL